MKYLSTLSLIVLFGCGVAMAQQTTTQVEETVIELPEKKQQPTAVQVVPAQSQQPQVVILPAAQQPVVEQPKTTVEAAPLVKSRAEQLREARQGVEIQTEQKIVEKLEESRMQDERDRADRLFGDRFNKEEEKQEQPQAVAAPVPVQVIPVQTVQEDNTDAKLDEMKEEIIQEMRTSTKKVEPEVKKDSGQTYIGALVGGGDYPGLINVDSNEAFGVVIGTETGRFVLEGAYMYSNYFVSDSIFIFKDLDQQNFMFTAKYNILEGKVKPQAGLVGSYTLRKYTDGIQGSFTGFEGTEVESQAFDLGLVLGVDVEVASNFRIGVDYKYMTNITYSDDFNTPLRNAAVSVGDNQLIEDSEYQIFSLSGKVTF